MLIGWRDKVDETITIWADQASFLVRNELQWQHVASTRFHVAMQLHAARHVDFLANFLADF